MGNPAKCKYHLPEVPNHVNMTKENREDESVVKWGYDFCPLPKIGQRVKIKMNGLGDGTVVAYFVEYGFIGVEVKADQLPEWMIKQRINHGRSLEDPCMVFAIEIELLP
jgi:hypothetical protein